MAIDIASMLETDLLPVPDRVVWGRDTPDLTLIDKVAHYAGNFFKFAFHLCLFPLGCIYSFGASLIQGKVAEVAAPKVEEAASLHRHFGFATSMYQDSGLGTSFAATPLKGECDWNEWLTHEHIEGSDTNYSRFFFDILREPAAYIDILKQQNVTAHRFSLEWAVIEPEPGQIDREAVALYRNFIQELLANGIEPYVTLHHFVCPKWFKDNGGFDNVDQIEVFKDHALKMMEWFPEVRYWMPFNEINVDGFQKCVRGVYPPGHVGDIAMAGRMMRSMLMAHCLIYKEAKERWPDKQIGSTHQWLKFEPLCGNLLEEAICYFLSKITHYACYNFFKTGRFALEIPACANVQFEIPEEEFEKHRGFSDFIGVQFYGFPRIKAGFNGNQDYPGYGITNAFGLTFGSTCPPGGIVQSFGPSFYPESLESCLNEAKALIEPFPGKTIVISETGCDARVWKFGEREWSIDLDVQKLYFEKILPILEQFKASISALFVWTLADGQEWERGDFPILNVGKIIKENGQIKGYEPHPAALLLQNL